MSQDINSFGLSLVSHDFEKSRGGFLVINETQDFSIKFLERLDVNTLKI